MYIIADMLNYLQGVVCLEYFITQMLKTNRSCTDKNTALSSKKRKHCTSLTKNTRSDLLMQLGKWQKSAEMCIKKPLLKYQQKITVARHMSQESNCKIDISLPCKDQYTVITLYRTRYIMLTYTHINIYNN